MLEQRIQQHFIDSADLKYQSAQGLSKPIAPTYPKIAGQHSDYVYAALRAYKTENKPQIGRNNPIMGGVVKQFSDKELKEIARYVESLPTTLQTIQPNRFR